MFLVRKFRVFACFSFHFSLFLSHSLPFSLSISLPPYVRIRRHFTLKGNPRDLSISFDQFRTLYAKSLKYAEEGICSLDLYVFFVVSQSRHTQSYLCVDVWMCGCVDVWMCGCAHLCVCVCACMRVCHCLPQGGVLQHV